MFYCGTTDYTYKHWNTPKKLIEFITNTCPNLFKNKQFTCLETNTTFYGHPLTKTIKNWENQLKDIKNLKLTVKLNKWMTHNKKLNISNSEWNYFWHGNKNRGGIKYLKNILGCILIQLPSNFKANDKNILKLQKLEYIFPKDIKFAFEFRDNSWYSNYLVDSIFIENKNWTLAKIFLKNVDNWAGNMSNTPDSKYFFNSTTDFVYFRFHGTISAYKGSYYKCLKEFSTIFKKFLSRNITVFAIFDNTDSQFGDDLFYNKFGTYSKIWKIINFYINDNEYYYLPSCVIDAKYLIDIIYSCDEMMK